ncbi:MAG: TonB-dependent receptor [Candidatus Latescibacteria bacterium]|nr:TonB-dependent receptor [Candidatus Latescibacterota bacterium]
MVQLQHSAELGPRQRFIYGADAMWTRPDTGGTITGNNEEDDDINEYGAYVQSETALSDKLDLVLALRYDDHNRLEDPEISPRAALVYKPQQTQTMRLTYNRAFSTPTTNNLYLDLVSSADPFGLGANFAPVLGFNPAIAVRAQGTYRDGFDEGFTFPRDAGGRPMFRSPFAPVAGLSSDQYLPLDDPQFTNVMWGIGRSAALAQFVPAFEQIAAGSIAQLLVANGMDAGDAQVVAGEQAQALAQALPGVIPAQLPGLQNVIARLNLETSGFDPVADTFDVPRSVSTITQTIELGYKGVLGGKLVVAVDAYQTKTEDFGGPLAVETPNVFLEPQSLAASLGQGIGEALADPANEAIAQALGALDQTTIPGVVEGNGNGSPVDELVGILVGGAARIPFGTVSPEQAYDPNAVLLTYRNFGDVTINGLDLSLAYYPDDNWTLTGNYSFVDDNFFSNLGGIADVALNAPKHKVKVGAAYNFTDLGLELGGRVRYSDSFQLNSGVYVGEVESYNVVDLNLAYRLPTEQDLVLRLDVANVLDNSHREFVGAPEIGRVVYGQIGIHF